MAEGESDFIFTRGSGSGRLGVVGAIGVVGHFSPPSMSKVSWGLKSNLSERRGLWDTDADRISSAVITALSLSRNRLCATRIITSKGDRGFDSPIGHQLRPSQRWDKDTGDKAHLNLTYNREEQILTEIALGTEGDEDECGDQVQQGALNKQRSDPVAKSSTCTDFWSKVHHVTYDMSRQVDIEPA